MSAVTSEDSIEADFKELEALSEVLERYDERKAVLAENALTFSVA
jgi:hypothetical protein